MQTEFHCPVCGDDRWEIIESFAYSIADGLQTRNAAHRAFARGLKYLARALVLARPRSGVVTCDLLSPYHKLRRKVLFDVWFKGRKEVALKTVYCLKCGFACYTPRPDDRDISDKYRYLKKYEPDLGGQTGHSASARRMDRDRAAQVHRQCMRYASRGKLRVLDYGGGDGRLLRPFLDDGHDCFIIDYNDSPVPGVTKLGDDIDSSRIPAGFDVIVCSHVLEHVSDVSGLVTKLKKHLKAGGIAYAEVPRQVWGGIRIDADPVTHINFFTANSLSNLFISSGYRILSASETAANYGAKLMEVIRVIAGTDQVPVSALLPVDIGESLYPSRISSLKKISALAIGKIWPPRSHPPTIGEGE